MKSILILCRNPNLPSFRYRMQPVIDHLESKDFKFEIITIPNAYPIYRIWRLRHRLKQCDGIYIQKMKLMTSETRLIQSLNKNIFFDVDDAIYLKQPKNSKQSIKVSRSRLKKFNATSRAAIFTSVGNSVLQEKAISAGGNTVQYPTGIDTKNYAPISTHKKNGGTVVWIGLPDNLKYLELVKPALQRLKNKYSTLNLKIVSSKPITWNNFPINNVAWSSEAEKDEVPSSDIGIMPLFDDEYSRGKCAFKLLQYMAAGVPCIASPVGANCDVITHGENGFLAATDKEWEECLDQLLHSQELRQSMGQAGRAFVVEHFDTEKLAGELGKALLEALRKN